MNSNQAKDEAPERDLLALSDAALRLAGHDVTDEHVRQLGREVAQGHYLPTKQSLVYGVLP